MPFLIRGFRVLASLVFALGVLGPLGPRSLAAEPSSPAAPREKLNIAILVYDQVQVIDYAGAFEVFSRFALDNVYLVSKTGEPITTWRGLRLIPNTNFADGPDPDIVVVPGGDTRVIRDDPEVLDWLRRSAGHAQAVLGVCTGVSIMNAADLLDGLEATTFYGSIDKLKADPDIHAIEDRLFVDAGKMVTTGGTGIEAALHVLRRIHGAGWENMTRLHMEVDASVPGEPNRVSLGDMNLPDAIWKVVSPWEADLTVYDGDQASWEMRWHLDSQDSLSELGDRADTAFSGEPGWDKDFVLAGEGNWVGRWDLVGRDGLPWVADVDLSESERGIELGVRVRRVR